MTTEKRLFHCNKRFHGTELLVAALVLLSCTAFLPRQTGDGAITDEYPQTASQVNEVHQDWWQQAQEYIRRSEYNVTWQKKTVLPDISSAWQAPNRAHGFRTYFTENGFRIVPRTGNTRAWEWGLGLVGYGARGSVKKVSAGKVAVKDNRVEIDRGDIVEWYLNDERGLEQGFTLKAPAAGIGADEDSMVVLALRGMGTLIPNLTEEAGSQVIELTTPGGVRVMLFGQLKAFDATGKKLPAQMQILEHGRGPEGEPRYSVRFQVDTKDAVYPVTIDPLATTANWTAESDQAGARFGYSVSTAGDVNGDGFSDVIVGAPNYDHGENNEGRAFVYHGSASGLGAAVSWTAEGGQADANFGWAVATAGDVNGDGYSDVIIGAIYYDFFFWPDRGAVFIYFGSQSGLSDTVDSYAVGQKEDCKFGWSVGTAGDVNGDGFYDVIVGAPEYDTALIHAGRAYVYYGNASKGLSVCPRQFMTDMSTPLSLLGEVDSETNVIIKLTGHMPLGREQVKLEWQAASLGSLFSSAAAVSGISTGWIDTGLGGSNILETITGLTKGTAYHWRARMVYMPGNRLGQHAGRWLGFGPNGSQETDFRTSPDAARPTVTMTSSAGNPTHVSSIPVTVQFSESVTGFEASDVTLSNATLQDFSGSGASYTFTFIPGSPGTVTVDIAANAAHDAHGNGNTAATQFIRKYRCCELDFDGDGKSDLAVFYTASGWWYFLPSSTGVMDYEKLGEPGYTTVPGDYDGDATTDVAVYNDITGWWYYILSSTGTLGYNKLGEAGYKPVQGDYDGDGRTDLAVYHEASGFWYVINSSDGSLSYTKFGEPDYEAVHGDYDADGKTDLAVFYTPTGWWYYLPSSTGVFSYEKLGEAGYTPVPGDYDGDGQTSQSITKHPAGGIISSPAPGLLITPSSANPATRRSLPITMAMARQTWPSITNNPVIGLS